MLLKISARYYGFEIKYTYLTNTAHVYILKVIVTLHSLINLKHYL